MTTVTANGFPKSGNHALVKALELLGLPASVNHIPYGRRVESPHLFVVRDPRNVVCSALRHLRKPVTSGTFMAQCRRFGLDHEGRTLVTAMGEYEGWLSEAFVVRYETLVREPGELKRIAAFLDVPCPDDAFTNLPGHTLTWHAEHSDYRKVWNDDVVQAWRVAGGDELLARWGY